MLLQAYLSLLFAGPGDGGGGVVPEEPLQTDVRA